MDWPLSFSPQNPQMISLSIAAFFKVAFFFLAIIAVVDLLTMSQPRRIRMLTRCGHSQRRIARRLKISRHRVRMALA